MTNALLETNLVDLAQRLGPLPPGDVPAAWWMSEEPEVLSRYAAFESDHKAWRDRMTELMDISGFVTGPEARQAVRIARIGEDHLAGLYPPPGITGVPRWWRKTPQGYLVPRKRTIAEKNSAVQRAFGAARHIPRAVNYLPELPTALWTERKVYPVHARKPAGAVLVFVGADPERASPAFAPGPCWTRLKLSTFHQLRERQAAGGTEDG